MPRHIPLLCAFATLALLALPSGAAAGDEGEERPLFEDRSDDWGLDFVHRSGATGTLLMPEMMGPGAALFDYDGDGDLDLYLVQGRSLAPENLDESGIPRPAATPEDRLYRNDPGPSGPRLVDVTATALPGPFGGYGMGIAVADPDDDGDLDLYRTALGPDVFLANRGDGTFSAFADPDPAWSTSASFVDVEGDGDLDLFVARYLEYSFREPPTCFAISSGPDYCGPSDLQPARDRLLLNRGNGAFVDSSDGLRAPPAPGLGVAVLDGNLDGRPEILVANDGAANHLWRWRSGEGMQDLGELAGVAYNQLGRPEASMGIAIGDVDQDARPDLFVTHLSGETDTLYVNESDLFFDRTLEHGLGPPSLPWTGFGTAFVDPDLDGAEDLVILHGAVRLPESPETPGPRALAQPPQLLLRRGARFVPASPDRLGLPLRMVGRGLAVGDLDGDGGDDLLVTETDERARIVRSVPPPGGRWLAARIERRPGAPAQGTRVVLRRSGAPPGPGRWVATDGSYLSARDFRVLFGLGVATPAALEIHHPSGRTLRWLRPPVHRVLVTRELP